MFEKLFGFGHGQGYPKERVVPEQRNKKILDGVRSVAFRHPVSYTHLDVYKRQLLFHLLPNGIQMAFYLCPACQYLDLQLDGADFQVGYKEMCIRDRFNASQLAGDDLAGAVGIRNFMPDYIITVFGSLDIIPAAEDVYKRQPQKIW